MTDENHESEARRDVNASWEDVAAHFNDLGRVIRERYRQQSEAESTSQGTPPPDVGPARQVVDALDDAFTALGEAVRDRAFQREAKGTLDSLGAALGVTFSELGEQLRERFNKPSR